MQVCILPIRKAALRPQCWSSAITLRALSISSALNKVPETLESPKHGKSNYVALPGDYELVKGSTPPKDPENATDFETPEEARRERKNAYNRNLYATKRATDPIWRENRLAQTSAWEMARRASDPEFRARQNQRRIEAYYTNMRESPRFAINHALRNWFWHSNTMDCLSWKTHLPVMSAEKVQRHCASCRVKRRDGLRLWWQRRQANLDDEYLYDCPSCFMKDLKTVLPEGFKDVETVQQLYERREQLLGIKATTRKSRTRTSSPPST
jgi:hypothetical protein